MIPRDALVVQVARLLAEHYVALLAQRGASLDD